MSKVLGIDLGNTSACMAIMEDGKPTIIPNAEGGRTTSSIVALSKSGMRLVGEAAKRQAVTNPENTLSSLLRLVGRKYDTPEVDWAKRLAPYRIAQASNGDAWIEMQGKQYSPPELLALVLLKLKIDAERYLGERVTQAVMTVPCSFNSAQCQAIKASARIAGLEILRLLRHPIAAALAYGLDKKKDERIAVYDLGGGTFDISILELGDGVFEVKSTNGDTHLGGDNFDQRILNWLADEFRCENGIDLRQDRMALQRLKEAAEKAKKELSSSMTTEINLPFITANASGPKHLNTSLTRTKLEQLVEELVEKSRLPVTKALSDAGTRASEIQEVVLVGGQTRMPAVQTLVKRIFGREPNRGVNPDEVVAIGAAILAGVLTGDVKDVLILDATPHSLGIETLGGVFTRLIERNTTLPTQKSQVFSTDSDDQSDFVVHVLQGEREFAKDNHSLGSFILDGIPPAPRGTPQIEVTFDIDANEILSVQARDKGTGREQRLTIHSSSGFSKDQLDWLAREAEEFANEYQRNREEREGWNSAESATQEAQPEREQASPFESTIRDADTQEREARRQSKEQGQFSAGQQIGNYHLLRLLGHGGFASVYLGEHRYLKTSAAIKVQYTPIQVSESQDFLQEAQALARLKHPHIVRVLDFGVENATPFLVMEYTPGGTLRDRHPYGTRLAPSAILPYVRQVASALFYAHQQKVVHRDVKPENMLLESDSTVLLSDFGIATVAHQTSSMSLQNIFGTVHYMAPEHIQGKARPASDQYSLAIVVYEWLCGQRPFTGTPIEIAMKHHSLPPMPLRTFVPDMPAAVEQVVLTALAKDPKQRFATVQAFATAFGEACCP